MVSFENKDFKQFVCQVLMRTADLVRNARMDNRTPPIRIVDSYYCLLAILRIKTIYLELAETHGIRLESDADGAPIKDLDFSKNQNYLAHYIGKLNGPRNFHSLLEKIFHQFISDTSPLAHRRTRKKAWDESDITEKEGFFTGILGVKPTDPVKEMIFKVIKFDLFQKKPKTWIDVRISRAFIRDAIIQFPGFQKVRILSQVKDNKGLVNVSLEMGYQNEGYIDTWKRLHSEKQRVVNLFDFIQKKQTSILKHHLDRQNIACAQWSCGRGFRKVRPDKRHAINHLPKTEDFISPRSICFQTMIVHPIGLLVVQPRRVAIYHTKQIAQHKEKPKSQEVLYGFCYYQYLELYKTNVGQKYAPCFFNWQLNYEFGNYSVKGRVPHLSYLKEFLGVKQQDRGNFSKFDCFLPGMALIDLPPAIREITAFDVNNCVAFHTTMQFGVAIVTHSAKEFTDKMMDQALGDKFKRSPALKGEFWYEDEAKIQWDKFLKADEKLIQSVTDEKGAAQLLRLIKSIPKIKFKLTPEQELMISTPQNVLCLGRSGTGKTTSSALRLFATDASYKYREAIKKHRSQSVEGPFKVNPHFMNDSSKLRLLFISASPVLVNEVKRFYIDFKGHFATELEKYQQAKEQQANQEAEVQIITTSEETEADELRKYIQNEIRALEDEETIEKQKMLARSMDDLSSDDFPLFLTVKRLLYMIDASTTYPFFARTSEGSQISMDSGVEWHNESGGVFMINQYFKGGQTYDNALKDLGNKILEIQGSIEEENDSEDETQQTHHKPSTYDAASVFKGLVTNAKPTMSIQRRNLSFEVDFEIFRTRFFPKVVMTTKLSPLVVWTEICSEIKGRVDSCKYECGGIPASQYIQWRRKKASGFLTAEERCQVYTIFLRYEQWKAEQGSYDLNDLVNHIHQQIKQEHFKRETRSVHFLMVDEVQDLTQNVISCLLTLAEHNIFFSGDTAQTIAKGVGFRFYDLKKVFERYDYENEDYRRQIKPKVLQLSKNFRSHSKILDLANSVVSLLELLFPKTIDKLRKETSDSDGPKPIVINHSSTKLLENLFNNYRLWGGQFKQEESSKDGVQRQQFGCDRVVIVRDQESKSRVPAFMREMLCLTVYEAKGLEFDEVILFNFFQDSKCDIQWSILQNVKAVIKMLPVVKLDHFLDFDQLEVHEVAGDGGTTNFKMETEEEKTEIKTNKIEGDFEMSIQLILNADFDDVYRKFAQVCTELKLLYVAITRPKNLLIIYDENQELRNPIQRYWESVMAVNVVTQEMLQDVSLIPQEVKAAFMMTEQVTPDNGIEKSQLKWRLQGFRLFKAKFYQAAIQCFRNSGDQELAQRCLAYEHADRGSTFKGQSEELLQRSKDTSTPKRERPGLKQKAKELLAESQASLSEAGRLFAEINMNKHAAQCFFSARNAVSAAELFLKMGKFGQAAESFYKLGNLRKAAGLYAQAELFANAFDCYERLEDWDGLILCLNQFKDKFNENERQSYIEKYFPIALNSLYQLFTNLDPEGASQALGGISEENKGRIQQMKLRLKFQKSVSMIKEEANETEEEEEMSSSEEEPAQSGNEQEKNLDEHNNEISRDIADSINEDPSYEIVEGAKSNKVETVDQPEFEMIDTTSKKQKPIVVEEIIETKSKARQTRHDPSEETKEQDESQSFEILKEQDSFERLEASEAKQDEVSYEVINNASLRQLELELLSNLDPEDEFLQSQHSFSLIEQVSLSDSSYSIVSSQSAGQFSVIAGSQMHSIIKSIISLNQQDASIDKTMTLTNTSGIESAEPDRNSALSEILNSSRYSVIQSAGAGIDQYAEDIVMQKVIYYVSLFSAEVRERLSSMRSKDFLSQALADQIEDQPKVIDGDQIYEENLEYMLIDLDNLNTEFLNLVLDTLEYYELFRLCLIVGNRYKLTDKNGRYVAAICQKYSNLSQFRITAHEKFRVFGAKAAQQKYAMLAQEAMNNVLSLANYGRTSQDVVWRTSCFDSLFLHGFWKKLVFLLDADSSLQLCFATKDVASFKLGFMVHKLGITDPKLISEVMGSDAEFSQILNAKDVTKDDSFYLAKQIQEHLEVQEIVAGLLKAEFIPAFTKILQQQRIGSKQVRLVSSMIAQIHSFYKPQRFRSLGVNIIEICLEILKTLLHDKIGSSEKRTKLLRAIYEPWGLTLFDGLDLFDSFSPNYMLLCDSRQKFGNEIQQRQEALIHLAKVKMIADLVPKMKDQNLTNEQITAEVKRQLATFAKTIEQSKEVMGLHMALACDIELDLQLIPKDWAFELVIQAVLQYCLSMIKAEDRSFEACRWLTQLQGLIDKAAQPMCVRVMNIKEGLYRQKHGSTVKTLVDQCALFNNLAMKVRQEERKAQISALMKNAQSQIVQSISFTTLTEFYIQRKPNFTPFKSPIVRADQKSRILDFAYRLALQALSKQLNSNGGYKAFCKDMYTALQAIIACDFYTIMSELLTSQKQAISRSKGTSSKVDAVWHILDAHVFAKVNDYDTSAKFLFKYLGLTNGTLATRQIFEVVETAFYQSLLSMCISTYKESHGGVFIPTKKYQKYIDRGSTASPLKVGLQAVWCKPSNLKQIHLALQWVASIVKSVNESEEAQAYADIFDSALLMLQCCCKNLFSEQIFELAGTVSDIYSKTVFGKLDIDYKRMASTLKDFDQIKYVKSSQEAKRYSSLFKSFKLKTEYTCVFVVDRKHQSQFASETLSQISSATKQAGVIEKSVQSARREAAAKIQRVWQQLRLRRVKRQTTALQYEASCDGDLDYATTVSDLTGAAMKACDQLTVKLTNIMGSTLIQNSLDLQYILDKIHSLTKRRLKVQAKARQAKLGHSTVAELTELGTQLGEAVKEIETKLGEWLEKRNELRSVAEQEREKRKFMKTEKWNSTISFHKKKRVLLRHLKKY